MTVVEALQAVKNGADVYGYELARMLRQLQKESPELLTILNLKELEEVRGRKYDGTKRLPYFGAILTAEGKKYLRELKKREKEKSPVGAAPNKG